MKIQVIGSGCSNCRNLYTLTKEAAAELQLTDSVEYSTDVTQIIAMGVMQSPVLAIDGKPVMVGYVPDKQRIKDVLQKSIT